MASWHWPQWVMFVLLALSVISAPFMHDQPREPKWHVGNMLAEAFFYAFVLYAGGFWQ